MRTARPLTRSQLRRLERELRRERAQLERLMAGRADAPADSGVALGGALTERTIARHDALTRAIRRIEARRYGRCIRCRAPIAYGRLIVMPEATHCVTCGSGGRAA